MTGAWSVLASDGWIGAICVIHLKLSAGIRTTATLTIAHYFVRNEGGKKKSIYKKKDKLQAHLLLV